MPSLSSCTLSWKEPFWWQYFCVVLVFLHIPLLCPLVNIRIHNRIISSCTSFSVTTNTKNILSSQCQFFANKGIRISLCTKPSTDEDQKPIYHSLWFEAFHLSRSNNNNIRNYNQIPLLPLNQPQFVLVRLDSGAPCKYNKRPNFQLSREWRGRENSLSEEDKQFGQKSILIKSTKAESWNSTGFNNKTELLLQWAASDLFAK